MPVVYGEVAHEGGYHYYPRIEQVRHWLMEAHFRIIDEAVGAIIIISWFVRNNVEYGRSKPRPAGGSFPPPPIGRVETVSP